MSTEFTTALISLLPAIELKLGLPWGMTFGQLSPLVAFVAAFGGNFIGVVLGVYLLEPVVAFARRHVPPLERFFRWVFAHTRHHHSKRFKQFGIAFLVAIVAIPIPGIGAYTAVLVAYLFDVPRRTTLAAISAGLVICGFILIGITTGGLHAFEFLRPQSHLPAPLEHLLPSSPRSSTAPTMEAR